MEFKIVETGGNESIDGNLSIPIIPTEGCITWDGCGDCDLCICNGGFCICDGLCICH